jgi:hypothetical protein
MPSPEPSVAARAARDPRPRREADPAECTGASTDVVCGATPRREEEEEAAWTEEQERWL